MSGYHLQDIELPHTSAEQSTSASANLILDAKGNMYWNNLVGEQALKESIAVYDAMGSGAFFVYADKNVIASKVAEVLRYLAQKEVIQVNLVVEDN